MSEFEEWYLKEYKGIDHGEIHKYGCMNAFDGGYHHQDEKVAELESEVKELNGFMSDLRDECRGFADAVDSGTDPYAAHDGFYVLYDDVIAACGGGSYGHDPLELIGALHNDLEAAEQKVKELETKLSGRTYFHSDAAVEKQLEAMTEVVEAAKGMVTDKYEISGNGGAMRALIKAVKALEKTNES